MLFVILLLVQIGLFGLLAVLLKYLLTKNIQSTSGHLQELTQQSENELEHAKGKREDAEKYYNEKLTKVREETEQVKKRLIGEGEKEHAEIIKRAREQSEEIMERARNSAEALLQELEQKIELRAISKSGELVQELLKGKISEETHSHWVEELLEKGLDGLGKMNIPEAVHEVEVVSAFPLKPKETKLIEERLKEKLGRSVQLKGKVDPSLIMGLQLTLGQVVVDGTLESKIKEYVRRGQHKTGG